MHHVLTGQNSEKVYEGCVLPHRNPVINFKMQKPEDQKITKENKSIKLQISKLFNPLRLPLKFQGRECDAIVVDQEQLLALTY